MLLDSNTLLNPPQQFVMDAKLLETGFSCVLQLSTGTGKTWLAKKAIMRALERGCRSIYLTPLRALANEIHPTWQEQFAPYEVGIFTGDYGKDGQKIPVSFANAKVLIMTPERLDACTRNWRSHWHWIPEVDLIVIDEVHLLGDLHRGARLEGAINRFRRLNPFSKYLCLSATLGNREELADWFQGIEFESNWRPVPLSWRIVKYRKADQKPDLLAQEVSKTVKECGKSLVFVQSRRRCETLSNYLKDQGINASYHHAGLSHKKRRAVEQKFCSSGTDALIATGTLEMGLNMPVRQVVLYDTQAFNGSHFTPLSVNTVWQRAGRAGRPGLDSAGEAVLFSAAWDKQADRYSAGRFERIESNLYQPQFLAEQIVAEIGAGLCRSELQIERALNHSLSAFQGKTLQVTSTIKQMINAGMIRILEPEDTERSHMERLVATPLGRIATRHLLQPATVEIIKALFSEILDFTNFDALFVLALTPDCEPIIPVDYEELAILSEQLSGHRSFAIKMIQENREFLKDPSGKRILSALKTAAVLLDRIEYDDDETLSDEYSIYPFELRRLQETFERLLLAAVAISKHVLSVNHEEQIDGDDKPEATKRLELLRNMIFCNLPAETASLTFIKGVGAKWAKKLCDNGFHSISSLFSANPKHLAKIPGLSITRAMDWQSMAKELASFEIPSTENKAPLIECDLPNFRNEKYDPYRMRRALELTVKYLDVEGEYMVSGGLEPHRVSLIKNDWYCDCADFAKGNLCKHILAVRHQQNILAHESGNSKTKHDEFWSLDLFSLWFEL